MGICGMGTYFSVPMVAPLDIDAIHKAEKEAKRTKVCPRASCSSQTMRPMPAGALGTAFLMALTHQARGDELSIW